MKKIFILLLILCFLITCGKSPENEISVVTFNMYVGFSVEDKVLEYLEGADGEQIAQEIFEGFQNSDPDARIEAAAKELAELSPDFIALQEVTSFSVLPAFSVNYLTSLIAKILEAGGPEYQSLVSENITINQQVDTGTLIPVSVIYSDSEAILYKKDFKIEGEVVSQKLPVYRDPVIYDGQEIVFYRSVLGAKFMNAGSQLISFFTTHLDQEYLENDIQKKQMQEVLLLISPFMNDENVVLVGDFNSEEGEQTYELIPEVGFSDTFRSVNPSDEGFTCCNLNDLSNTQPVSTAKIDLIFNKSAQWNVVESRIILNAKDPVWPSDHFGVLTIFHKIVN